MEYKFGYQISDLNDGIVHIGYRNVNIQQVQENLNRSKSEITEIMSTKKIERVQEKEKK